MSTGYILKIHGMSRYDVANVKIIGGKNIIIWKTVKEKLGLTDNEISIFKNKIKSITGITIKEDDKGLHFDKQVDELQFNKILSDFCVEYKICNKCGIPEINDNICKACSYNNDKLQKIDNKEAILKLNEQAKLKRKNKREQQSLHDKEKYASGH